MGGGVSCSEAHDACINIHVFTEIHSDVYNSPAKKTLAVCKFITWLAMPSCCALFVVLVGRLLRCRHLITCAIDVCCIFIALHYHHCSYVMYMFFGKSHFDVVMWVTYVHSQWAERVFVYIHRRLQINQLIELRSKWNYGIYGTHQNELCTVFFFFFVGLWFVKLVLLYYTWAGVNFNLHVFW